MLTAILLLASTLHATPDLEIHLEPQRPGAIIVEFRPTATPAATFKQFRADLSSLSRLRSLSTADLALKTIRYEYRNAMLGAAVDVPAESIDAIRQLPYVRAVYPDRVMKALAVENASTIDAATRVNAGSLATRGEGITIGVIDTGIDYRHPAFGNGFGPGHKVAGGWDFVNKDADPLDDHGHGTHVAGIIAADSPELSGVAPAATLYAYKVLDYAGRATWSDVIAAIERSIDPNQDGDPADHLRVINISLGGPGNADDPVSRAVDNATAAGITVVVAAGNEGVVGSILSPGTARTAITVGAVDGSGTVTTFSSRGPSPASLAFKPDVTAPGLFITSAQLGGGLVTFSGTSMAAPHVAGTAALLAKLHPDWTPADIKSALITTALATNGSPVERAAGRIDAARASEATTFIDGSGVSFGLAPGKSGTSETTRTVTVTNRAADARTFEIVPKSLPAGATLTASPPTLQLAPGASQSVELKLTADNAQFAFPENGVAGGDIEFRGTSPFTLPWFVIRGARITVSYDSAASNVRAFSADGYRAPFLYEPGKAEIFVRPGSKWDVIVSTIEANFSGFFPVLTGLRMVVAENNTAVADNVLSLRRDDANGELTFDSRDERGEAFGEFPLDNFSAGHAMSLRMFYDKDGQHAIAGYHFGGVPKIYMSPVSSSFTFHPFETFVDLPNGRVFNIQHPSFAGFTGSKKLGVTAESYRHARLRFPLRGQVSQVFACAGNGPTANPDIVMEISRCFAHGSPQPLVVDYYTTTDAGGRMSGVDFDSSIAALTYLRGVDGSIVSVYDPTLSPASYRISQDEELAFGTLPVFPFVFYGTAPGPWHSFQEGFRGPAGEYYRYTTDGTAWTMFDANNAKRAEGTISLNSSEHPPAASAGDRLVAVREQLNVAGQTSRGELEVRFGTNAEDLVAPTLTSLRVTKSNGRLTDRVDLRSAASLVFSAADFNYPTDLTRQLNSAATRVSYRVHGTGEWRPLTVVLTGTDEGNRAAVGHIPAGDLYRVDLSAATPASGFIDLRIELEDAAGNRTSWTQAPAFAVGTATSGTTRRRSVR